MALEQVGVQLTADGATAFERQLNNASDSVRRFGDTARTTANAGISVFREVAVGALREVGTAAINMAADATRAIGSFAADSIGAAASFEKTMSGIQAVLSPTVDEFEDLGAAAIRLGRDTQYGASDAAGAIEMLAKNGLTATQISNGAIDATLALAAATGSDLAAAADIATDAMASFGIEAADMQQAVNGITGVVVSSKFDVVDYQYALAQAGAVAAGVGVEFGDFNAAIAAISPSFASGSDAGTSFKAFLQRLVPASGPAEDAMRDLGIITADGANQFYDAEGNLRSMTDIVGLLAHATAGLSEEQKNNTLSTIFGTDALRVALGLASTGPAAFDALSASIGRIDAGSQAATRMDNFSGALESLRGSIETVQIQIGTYLLPILRDLIDRYAIPAVNAFGAFASGVLSASDPLAALAQQVQTFGTQVQTWVVAATPRIISTLARWGAAFVEWVVPVIPRVLDGLGSLIAQVMGWISKQAPAISAQAREWGRAVVEWIVEATPMMLAAAADFGARLIAGIGQTAPELIDMLSVWSVAVVEWLVNAIPPMLGTMGQFVGALIDQIGLALPGIVESLAAWGAAIVEWAIDSLPALLEQLGLLYVQVAAWIAERGPGIAQQLGDWAVAFVEWIGPVAADLVIALGELLGTFLAWITDHNTEIGATAATWAAGLVGWIYTDAIPALSRALLAFAVALLSDMSSKMGMLDDPMAQVGTRLVASLLRGIIDGWSDIIWFVMFPGMERLANVLSGDQGMLNTVGMDMVNGVLWGLERAWGNVMLWADDSVSMLTDKLRSALQIGSPSRLMAEQVGEPAGEGVAIGMQRPIAALASSVPQMLSSISPPASSISPPASPAQIAGPQNSTTNTNTRNYNLAVSTQRSAGDVVSDFAIMEAMAR